MFCNKCGYFLSDKDKVCPKCGEPVDGAKGNQKKAKKEKQPEKEGKKKSFQGNSIREAVTSHTIDNLQETGLSFQSPREAQKIFSNTNCIFPKAVKIAIPTPFVRLQ